MGLLSFFRNRFSPIDPISGQIVTYSSMDEVTVLGMGPEELYRTQPYLRIVIDFLARNIAQLGVHTFERAGDNDRRRVHDSPVAKLLASPNEWQTTYELIYGTVADRKLYDVAVWWIQKTGDADRPWRIRIIPPAWMVGWRGGDVWSAETLRVKNPTKPDFADIPVSELVVFRGWEPGDPRGAVSALESLRGILAEQIQANRYRQQLWERGGRVGAFLTRPKDAPWSKEAQDQFAADWQANWTGSGPKAGGTPILQDGMEMKRLGFSAREDEWVDAAKLSLAIVASVYHVNPTMVGLLDNANFSNVREFRKMLYGDTIGPDLALMEDRINSFLIPMISPGNESEYCEFNIAEKMQGSFEEQAQVLSSSVGRPWMTADEARSRQNMPALGGDAGRLVTPLNVLVGGQASPRDSAPGKAIERSGTKADARRRVKSQDLATDEDRETVEVLLAKFFKRQKRVVASELGSKSEAWWDGERWDRELGQDLYVFAVSMATRIGEAEARQLGYTPGDYDEGRTLAFLKAVADSRAKWINNATYSQIEAALDDPDNDAPLETVFSNAVDQRTGSAAGALCAGVAGFAAIEAGKQLGGQKTTKTWVTSSGNPRASHALMEGETVAINESFSNGMNWPGDPSGGADEVAGCMCGVEITIP